MARGKPFISSNLLFNCILVNWSENYQAFSLTEEVFSSWKKIGKELWKKIVDPIGKLLGT